MALEAVEETDCHVEAHHPDVGVAVADAGDSVQLDVSSRDVLDLELRNNGSQSGVVTVTATVASEAGRHVRNLGSLEIAPGSTRYGVSITDLELPEGKLAFSGIITIAVKITYANGIYDEDSSLRLSFHRADSGWAIYDSATRESMFEGGALTAEARELRQAALQAAGAGEEAFVASSRGVRVSDSTDWVPISEDEPE